MRKYFISFTIAAAIFVLTVFLLNKIQKDPLDLIVEVNAIVEQDDVFQLFYQFEDLSQFAEKESVLVQVKGNIVSTKIQFLLPYDKPLKNLRLDVGNNRNQKAVVIKSLKFIYADKSTELNFQNSFIPNQFIISENGNYQPIVLQNNYDPFFTSDFNVQELIDNIILSNTLIPQNLIYLIAFVFFMATFSTFLLKNIKIYQLSSKLYILAFFLILLTPAFVKHFNLVEEVIVHEKRKLAVEPDFQFSEDYPQQYEQYFNDNFGLRSNIINWSAKFKIALFKSSPEIEKVQFGNNGFMFLASNYAVYPSYTRSNLFSDDKLEKVFKKKAS